MRTLLIAAGIAALTMAPATAATLDFATAALGNEGSVEGDTQNFGFVDVTFDANDDNYAYYDDANSAGRPAGLGVCSEIDGDLQCVIGSDDNITSGESVTLTFSHAIDIAGLTFRGEHHYLMDDGNGELSSTETLLINGQMYTFGEASTTLWQNVTEITFAYGGKMSEQFYVSAISVVPLPATLPLFAAGLLGLGAVSRRRRKA
jgi:hypothetical protein